jgi:hypothetical protein
MFRGMWRFGVFNAIQSTCFETVSLALLSCLFCVARVSTTDDFSQVYQSDKNVVVSAPTGE